MALQWPNLICKSHDVNLRLERVLHVLRDLHFYLNLTLVKLHYTHSFVPCRKWMPQCQSDESYRLGSVPFWRHMRANLAEIASAERQLLGAIRLESVRPHFLIMRSLAREPLDVLTLHGALRPGVDPELHCVFVIFAGPDKRGGGYKPGAPKRTCILHAEKPNQISIPSPFCDLVDAGPPQQMLQCIH